jgi:mannan endo-1,4-beta-mannosidase
MSALSVRSCLVRRIVLAPVAMTMALLAASTAPANAWFDDSPNPAPFDLAEAAPSAVIGIAGGPVVHFSVRGTQIFDPSGKPFVPVGFMVSGRHGASPQATLGITDTMKAWGFNTARVITCLDPQCAGQPVGSGGYRQNSDTDAIIRDLTARKAVAMLESYQIPAGSWPTPAQRVELGDWWERMAIRYRDNPYVWFNLINEPGENPGWGQGPADPQWLDWTSYLAGRIRATGAVNPIVADGSNNGQDVQYDTLDGKFGRPDSSAIISFGPELLRRHSNIIFSLHVWELWGRGTDAQNRARFDDYVNRVHGFGGALIFGEAGMSENGLEREGANIATASRAAFSYAADNKLGAIAFAIPNSNYPEGIPDNVKPYILTYANIGDASQINSLTSPTNLSKLGSQVWNYSRAIQASMPENAQMTDPIVGAPVFGETFDGGVPSTMHAANGAGLSIIGGNGGGQAIAVAGARNGDDPSIIWDAGNVLIPGNTYAISMQVRGLAIPDPIHVAFVGGPNPDWPNNPSTNGWAWATLNNRSTAEWSQTDFVLTIPSGNTGSVTFTANRGTPFAIENLVITQL